MRGNRLKWITGACMVIFVINAFSGFHWWSWGIFIVSGIGASFFGTLAYEPIHRVKISPPAQASDEDQARRN